MLNPIFPPAPVGADVCAPVGDVGLPVGIRVESVGIAIVELPPEPLPAVDEGPGTPVTVVVPLLLPLTSHRIERICRGLVPMSAGVVKLKTAEPGV